MQCAHVSPITAPMTSTKKATRALISLSDLQGRLTWHLRNNDIVIGELTTCGSLASHGGYDLSVLLGMSQLLITPVCSGKLLRLNILIELFLLSCSSNLALLFNNDDPSRSSFLGLTSWWITATCVEFQSADKISDVRNRAVVCRNDANAHRHRHPKPSKLGGRVNL
ncbi:hypothetical protein Agabi119p4_1074 [Agaricus bisporus var. burnettii]|uniref:Uncharacterized protein n=1 Tax=Agaricus bisporus var. burnettii TaxID=192524 RepID=A0A8H7FBX4_AGABI|nr:hypothetical protein Agabi119p4_1074 [Agaricus bisporus var. burnettii]